MDLTELRYGDRGERGGIDKRRPAHETARVSRPVPLTSGAGGERNVRSPMDVTESPMVTEVIAVYQSKAACARNSAGQPAASLDNWGGGREERTAPMDWTESGMVTEVSADS